MAAMAGKCIAIPFACLALLSLGACTVSPLYGTTAQGYSATGTTNGSLPIYVLPPSGRDEQIVRNEMVTLIDGGGAQQPGAPYQLDIDVAIVPTSYTYAEETAVGVISRDAATRFDIIVDYRILDASTATVVRNGRRTAFAETDRTDQEFATRSGARDAIEQASRDAARLVVLDVAALFKTGRLPLPGAGSALVTAK